MLFTLPFQPFTFVYPSSSPKSSTLPSRGFKPRLLYMCIYIHHYISFQNRDLLFYSNNINTFIFGHYFKLAVCKVDQDKTILCKKTFLHTYFSIYIAHCVRLGKQFYHPEHSFQRKQRVKFTKCSELNYQRESFISSILISFFLFNLFNFVSLVPSFL